MREPTCLGSLLHLNSMSSFVQYSMNMFEQYVTYIYLNRMMRCDEEHNIHEYIMFLITWPFILNGFHCLYSSDRRYTYIY